MLYEILVPFMGTYMLQHIADGHVRAHFLF